MTDADPGVRRAASAHVLLDVGANLQAAPIDLPDDIEHHLRRVLRLRDGESVTVTDGAGSWRACTATLSGNVLALTPVAELVTDEPPTARLEIVTAIPKGDRVDWLVQKVTELGADRIQFIHAERSVVRWKPDRAAKQLTRLQRIADEATRQSRRVWRTTVVGPDPAGDVLAGAVVAEPGGREVRRSDSTIAVGPEGGWSAAELDLAAGQVRLGPHIMRTETAAIAATTLWAVASP